MKIKLLLNVLKRNNYVFYDKVNKLHLSLSSPVGFANTVSQSVKRAILAGNIIDINNVTGIEVSKAVADRNELVLQRLGYKKEQVVLASSEDSNKNEEKLSTPAPNEGLSADDKSNEAPKDEEETKDPVNEEESKEDENADESAKEEAPKAKSSRKKSSKKDKEEEKAGEE